ncbi:hypothetical protein LDENG_00234670 [Lucifuga dentata]|nr:hypothetical protein LDENG_00234670 [Lucifuga dentata]
MHPVQRTHHDRTTPATGGVILVGKLKSSDSPSPSRPQPVSMATAADKADDIPVTKKEAWSENNPSHISSSNPSPIKSASSSPCKPIRTKHTTSAPPPHHCIQGTLRHPEFQHNGDLVWVEAGLDVLQDQPLHALHDDRCEVTGRSSLRPLMMDDCGRFRQGPLGLRFRDLLFSEGGFGPDEDDRLSVMSWHSAASCSMASSVLERAQRRRQEFWGKR